MVKTKTVILFMLFSGICLHAQEYEWKRDVMDGSRTGCVAVNEDNIPEALGRFEGKVYVAPDGRRHPAGSAAARTARLVLDAQPSMARVKKVVAYSEEELYAERFETPLSNWFVDIVMDKAARISRRKVDVGICNFGGIRVNMPAGPVILDDMLSMFPFKNTIVYLELSGRQLMAIFEKMAAGKFEALGGVNIVAENGKVTSALIGGAPVDADRMYGVATISFLLYGGDSLTLADGAQNLNDTGCQIIDAVLEHLEGLTAAGHAIKAPKGQRVIVK